MRAQVIKVPLDGTNDVDVPISVPFISATMYADTGSVQLNVRPVRQSDFLPINNGGAFTFSEPGRIFEPTVVTLRAASAVTAFVVLVLP